MKGRIAAAIASSPTEPELRLGAKFYPNASSYKTSLANLSVGDTIIASQLSGDFVLPKNKDKKLVFIAGGIGVTPFRSMIKYLIDTKEKRDIAMVYANKTPTDIAYKDFFDSAAASPLGLKMIYTIDPIKDAKDAPVGWKGSVGYINGQMIVQNIPDFSSRMFYISGPHGMVSATEKTLKSIGVRGSQIKTDFFPGFA